MLSQLVSPSSSIIAFFPGPWCALPPLGSLMSRLAHSPPTPSPPRLPLAPPPSITRLGLGKDRAVPHPNTSERHPASGPAPTSRPSSPGRGGGGADAVQPTPPNRGGGRPGVPTPNRRLVARPGPNPASCPCPGTSVRSSSGSPLGHGRLRSLLLMPL